jgi:hypothetical protein
MSFYDYSKMNFRAITSKNIKSYTDCKVKLINKPTKRSVSPKKGTTIEKQYRLVLDIVLSGPAIPKAVVATPVMQVTPPTTRATTPVRSNRTITIYGKECEVDLPRDMDIYEGLRLYYPLLYTMVMDEEKEIAYETEVAYYERERTEYAMAHMDYLEWMYD